MDTHGKQNRELYLDEDKDILGKLESVGPMSTGIALSEQNKKLASLQIKATLRNRKSLDRSDKMTRIFSLILVLLTLVLIAVSVFQFTFDIQTSTASLLQKLIPLILLILLVVWIAWKAPKAFDEITK
jgi:flagellar biosynthesis protein FliQ